MTSSKHYAVLAHSSGQFRIPVMYELHGGVARGLCDVRALPPEIRCLFDEFEELVNGQTLSCLSDVMKRINDWNWHAEVEGGERMGIEDLQVFPSKQVFSCRFMSERRDY